MFEHTEPSAYGLGKSGWVTAKFPKDFTIPVDVLEAWIEESYRAQAPKKLVARMDGGGVQAPAKAPKKAAKRAAPAKATKKSAARPTKKRAKAPRRPAQRGRD